ncbi:MAG: capsular biosynthesis protein [Bacteroidales bacterium]|nr:capsular biosynthesis protein [Bacteroidales bacterium]MBR6929704.1 capsular biosynthesis protein [Bacteroidales bacterium]
MLFPKISSLLTGFTDHHSHILPGVDDGVKKMEVSLKVLERYEQLGIAEVWCTPHIMEDIPNTTEKLQVRFAELCEAYQGPIKLHLAAEYMMDALFEERLEQGDLLKLGDDGNQLLVETSYFTPPMDMDKILLRIKQRGLYPVLAHPERYVYMNQKRYTELKDNGIRFQLNLSSLAGAYGSEAKDKALWILKKEYYNLVGSDLHSLRNADYWSTRAPRALKKLLQQ